ncbi:hypothetical protein GCM10027598_63810 [Amycolatopsis oliviviridis]|uniref:Uncharacterized protein n=1 Tax=Amycolatopsis oliviviridis TaxID=1471590 RepID=A0ABQ3M6K9_9PSEU|nr:hypothetical protein [Amycolatopsis oliviviridis]GHH33459.1 hypothetical protein GCM10017790_72110 [Amycolatopsis oliviviridis]
MTHSRGFSVEVSALRRVASDTEDGLPGVSAKVGNASKSMRDLYVQPQAAFGGDSAGVALGQKRNALLAALITGGIAVSDSVGQAAERLDVVADAYERIEREVTGK